MGLRVRGVELIRVLCEMWSSDMLHWRRLGQAICCFNWLQRCRLCQILSDQTIQCLFHKIWLIRHHLLLGLLQQSLCIDTLHNAITTTHVPLPCTNLFQTRVLQLVNNLPTYAGAVSITNLQKPRSVRPISFKESGAAVVQVRKCMDCVYGTHSW